MATSRSGGKFMNQMGFYEFEFAAKKNRTRRECFLHQIEAATPWYSWSSRSSRSTRPASGDVQLLPRIFAGMTSRVRAPVLK